jgi:hypothetical protein
MLDLFTCLTITFCVCSAMDESECSSLGDQEKGNAVQSLVVNVRSVTAKEDKVLGCEEADGSPRLHSSWLYRVRSNWRPDFVQA